MPLYIFQHPETMEEVEIVQSMKDEHVYIDDAGTQWNRIFFATNASFRTWECFFRLYWKPSGFLEFVVGI